MRIGKIALTLLLGLCATDAAQAQTRRAAPGPTYGYVFADFAHLSAPGLTFDGGGLGVGWHFTRYLGIQAGGHYFRKSPVELTSAYAEAMLTYPVTDTFSVYGALGGSYMHGKANTGFTTVTGNSTGYRASIGIEHWFGRNFGLRAGYARQNAGWVADELGIGLAFRF